jgi:hypothetical protein
MVELVHLYSNPSVGSVRLGRLRHDALSHQRTYTALLPHVPQRVDRRLGAEKIERIVADYVSGTSSVVLARTHGIGKGTLLRLLRERKVDIRRPYKRSSSSVKLT